MGDLLPGFVQPVEAPARWETVQVRDIASVVQGGRLGLTKADYRESGVQAFSAAGQDGFVSQAEFHQPGVILSSIGANCGRCFRADGSWTTLANTQAILPDSARVDHRFLFARLNDERYWLRSGSAQPFIKPASVKRSWILRPPLEEQRRIAEILDTIDDSIQATERVVTKLELQRQAVSQAMFGRTSWRVTTEIVPVGSLLARPPRNGQSFHEAESWSGTFMLGLGCLTESGFIPRQLKWSPRVDDSLRQALLADGDLLMSRSNTVDRVGFIGRYVSVGQPCIYPDLMMRLVPRQHVLARYLELALQSEPARVQIKALASGTSGSMLKITGEAVARLCVPMCSPAAQARCCDAFGALASRRSVEELRLSKLRDLRSGLAADLLSGRVRTVPA